MNNIKVGDWFGVCFHWNIVFFAMANVSASDDRVINNYSLVSCCCNEHCNWTTAFTKQALHHNYACAMFPQRGNCKRNAHFRTNIININNSHRCCITLCSNTLVWQWRPARTADNDSIYRGIIVLLRATHKSQCPTERPSHHQLHRNMYQQLLPHEQSNKQQMLQCKLMQNNKQCKYCLLLRNMLCFALVS